MTQLEEIIEERITNNAHESKAIIEKQIKIFEGILVDRISESYRDIDKERLKEIVSKIFTINVCEEIDALFDHYKKNELEFYMKNLKTSDLIFNHLQEKRTQTIYLDSIIRKLGKKEQENLIEIQNIGNIFEESARNKYREEQKEENLSIDGIFAKMVKIMIRNPRLTLDESDELFKIATHYYTMYKNDMKKVIANYLDKNNAVAVKMIEEEMDDQKIRNGKTSAISRIERSITTQSLKEMDRVLTEIIEHEKGDAKEELKTCSSAMVDLIFKLLPPEYHDQKDLLEIIVDTNINERLGKLLESETKKFSDSLRSRNEDIIENELYEEKRYKEINEYECNFDSVEKVYGDVLHEIRIAYDIPEDDQQSKRLNLIVSGESNSTKTVFRNMIDSIKQKNQKKLQTLVYEMNELSREAHIKGEIRHQTSTAPKK